MVKGECRVIPIVIDKVKLPPEVGGLLYADFTSSFEDGLKKVLTALQYEANRTAKEQGVWSRATLAVSTVFGASRYCSTSGGYKWVSYHEVYLPVPSDESDETPVVYDIISGRPEPLSHRWWDEFTAEFENIEENLFLVVTERPIGFPTKQSTNPRVSVKTFPGFTTAKVNEKWVEMEINRYVVFAELAELEWEKQCEMLHGARELLIELAAKKGSARDRRRPRFFISQPSEAHIDPVDVSQEVAQNGERQQAHINLAHGRFSIAPSNPFFSFVGPPWRPTGGRRRRCWRLG
jgi:hypothetical protein